MSFAGRLIGGASINVVATMLLLVWLSCISAWVRAAWLARELPVSINVLQLAYRKCPQTAGAASVWWWARASGYAMFAFMTGLLATAAVAVIFDPWR